MRKKLFMGSLAASVLLMCGCGDENSSSQIEVNNPDINGGQILLYSTSGEYKGAANVGNLPDMVTFSHDGKFLVSANEGEPNSDYTVDAKGSISIIEIDASKEEIVRDVTTLTFDDVTIPSDVRIKPDSNASVDLEPEYVAITEDDKTAFVSLQENNAMAYVDLETKTITAVKSLGRKDLSLTQVDIVDDEAPSLAAAPSGVYALYQPDTIVSYAVNGQNYVITANEGDDREYDAYEDYVKAKSLTLDTKFNGTAIDGGDSKSLRVFEDLGKNASGIYEELYMAGTRSFSIWDAEGNQVFDSGSEFETEIATNYPAYFNTRVDDAAFEVGDDLDPAKTVIGNTTYFWDAVDARSLKKGVEPEALSIAKIGSSVYAYIGLEKQGGFFVYDITDPVNTSVVEYKNDIDYTAAPSAAGDLAPEGMVTFAQDNKNYLAIANELSSTVAIYELAADGKATKLDSLNVGSFDKGAAEILSYDAAGKALYTTNAENQTIDIIDVSTPANLVKSGSIDFSAYADNLQSVSVKNGLVAIAVKRKEN